MLAAMLMKLALRNQESLEEYVKRFNHEKLFVENLNTYVTILSFTINVKHNGLNEKFIME